MLESNDGALRSLDSSRFSVRVGGVEPAPAVDELWYWLLKPWLNNCQGTGIILPMADDPAELLGVPTVLERLEGTVSRPEVEVSETPPADDKDRIANSIRPLWGSTVKSRTWPKVLPSWDWTELFRIWLSRTLLPECIALALEPRVLDLEPRLLEF